MFKLFSTFVAVVTIMLFPPAVLAFISNNAVQGDLTYPIKRKLEDAIVIVASVNPTSKAWFSLTRSQRRFEESKKLLVNGKLPIDTLDELVKQTREAKDDLNKLGSGQNKNNLINQYKTSVEEYKKSLKKEEDFYRNLAEKERKEDETEDSVDKRDDKKTDDFKTDPTPTPKPTTRGSSPSPTPQPTDRPTPTPLPTTAPTEKPDDSRGSLQPDCPKPSSNASPSEIADYFKCIGQALETLSSGEEPKDLSLKDSSSVDANTPDGDDPFITTGVEQMKNELSSLSIDNIKIVLGEINPSDGNQGCDLLKYRISYYSTPLNAKITNSLGQLDIYVNALILFNDNEIITRKNISRTKKREIANLLKTFPNYKTESYAAQTQLTTAGSNFSCQNDPSSSISGYINITNNMISKFNGYKNQIEVVADKILSI